MKGTIVVLAAILLAVTGCNGGDDGSDSAEPSEDSRQLTLAEATRLAGVLQTNYESGGAHFTVNASTANGQLVLDGQIDFTESVARATVSGDAYPGLAEIAWTPNTVAERRTDLVELNPEVDQAIEWVGRNLDPAKSQLDNVLTVVAGLSQEQGDNPVLVRQEPDTAWLRRDELRSTPVDVMTYGANTNYWVTDEGVLLRFEGLGAPNQTVVDLSEFGPQTFEVPDQGQVTPIDEVVDWYPKS